MSYAIAGLLVMTAAWGWHGVTEHHWHLRYFWRFAVRDTVVPQVRSDTRWHGMAHARRTGVSAWLLASVVAFGTAWLVQPRVTVVTVIVVALLAAGTAGVRVLSRSSGVRRRPSLPHEREN